MPKIYRARPASTDHAIELICKELRKDGMDTIPIQMVSKLVGEILAVSPKTIEVQINGFSEEKRANLHIRPKQVPGVLFYDHSHTPGIPVVWDEDD